MVAVVQTEADDLARVMDRSEQSNTRWVVPDWTSWKLLPDSKLPCQPEREQLSNARR
jgi:hypothetical protein